VSATTTHTNVTATAFTGIDFAATGKQLGYGHVAHSDNVHDGSVIPVPLAVISSGPGQVALLVAGTHGDDEEINTKWGLPASTEITSADVVLK
jgi:predicted deacylase